MVIGGLWNVSRHSIKNFQTSSGDLTWHTRRVTRHPGGTFIDYCSWQSDGIEEVRSRIAENGVNGFDSDGMTPLPWASQKGLTNIPTWRPTNMV